MAVNKKGSNFTYSVGNQNWTQSQLNNNMPGTDANAIYYATHNGNGASPIASGSVTSTPVSSGGSGGGGGRRSSSTSISASSSGGGYGGGYDYAGMIQGMLDQQRAAAQAAYDASRARLEEAWGATKNSLSENLNSALNNLKANYDYGAGIARKDAGQSMREAYINYMLSRRNLGQNMAAMGLSGGATESNLAKMYNNYGNSQNNIQGQLASNLQELANTYNNNVASANQLYNSQYAEAMNNYVNNLNALEQALANNMMGSYSGSSLSNLASYASTLAELQNQMAAQAANYTPTQNTLDVSTLNTTQGTDLGSLTDYAKYQQMMQDMVQQGLSENNIIQNLLNNGASRGTIYQLYGAA